MFILHINITRPIPRYFLCNIPLQFQFLMINIYIGLSFLSKLFLEFFHAENGSWTFLTCSLGDTECWFQHSKLQVLQISANGYELLACTNSSPNKSPAEAPRTKRLPEIELYESDPAVGTTQRQNHPEQSQYVHCANYTNQWGSANFQECRSF